MKIELKKIKHVPSLSEETEAFTAELYIDGARAGVASNRGYGGNTGYRAFDSAGEKLIRKAEAYCQALPGKVLTGETGMDGHIIPMNLELFIDDLLYTHLEEKERARFSRKLEHDASTTLVFGKPGQSYTQLKFIMTIQQILARPENREPFINAIKHRVLPALKDGDILLNTNIPEDILRDAGLRPDQYRKPREGLEAPEPKKVTKNSRGKRP